MGNFPKIQPIIDAALALDLANPNFEISDKERLLKEAAIRLGTMDYYRSFPMRVIYMTTYNSTGGSTQTTLNWAGLSAPKLDDGQMYIPFNDFFTEAKPKIPTEQVDHAYFLGIMRIERPYWSNWSNPSTWQTYFFGYQVTGTSQTFDITNILLNNSYDELSTGQPRCWINRTENRLEVTAPFGWGQLGIDAAIGFDSPEYVEMAKVDFLCKFISYRFIEAVIQARDGVKFDADFQISTEALQRRLEKLKEETDSIKNHSILQQAQWS